MNERKYYNETLKHVVQDRTQNLNLDKSLRIETVVGTDLENEPLNQGNHRQPQLISMKFKPGSIGSQASSESNELSEKKLEEVEQAKLYNSKISGTNQCSTAVKKQSESDALGTENSRSMINLSNWKSWTKLKIKKNGKEFLEDPLRGMEHSTWLLESQLPQLSWTLEQSILERAYKRNLNDEAIVSGNEDMDDSKAMEVEEEDEEWVSSTAEVCFQRETDCSHSPFSQPCPAPSFSGQFSILSSDQSLSCNRASTFAPAKPIGHEVNVVQLPRELSSLRKETHQITINESKANRSACYNFMELSVPKQNKSLYGQPTLLNQLDQRATAYSVKIEEPKHNTRRPRTTEEDSMKEEGHRQLHRSGSETSLSYTVDKNIERMKSETLVSQNSPNPWPKVRWTRQIASTASKPQQDEVSTQEVKKGENSIKSYAHVRRVLSEHLVKIQRENGERLRRDPADSTHRRLGRNSGTFIKETETDGIESRNEDARISKLHGDNLGPQQTPLSSPLVKDDHHSASRNCGDTFSKLERQSSEKRRRYRSCEHQMSKLGTEESPVQVKKCKSIRDHLNKNGSKGSKGKRHSRIRRKKKLFGHNNWSQQVRTSISGRSPFMYSQSTFPSGPLFVNDGPAEGALFALSACSSTFTSKGGGPTEQPKPIRSTCIERKEESVATDIRLPAGQATGPPELSKKEVTQVSESEEGVQKSGEDQVEKCIKGKAGDSDVSASSSNAVDEKREDDDGSVVDVDTLRRELDNTKTVNAKIMEEMMKMQGKLLAMEKRFEHSGRKEKTIQDLESRIEQLTSRIQTVISKHTQTASESEGLRKDVESLEDTLSSLQSERDAAKMRAKELEAENDGKNNQLQTLKRQTELMGHQVTGAENQAFRLQNKLKAEQSKRKQIQEAAAAIREQVIQAAGAADNWNSVISQRVSELDKKLSDVERKKQVLAAILLRAREQQSVAIEKEKDRRTCVICFETKVEVVLVPCGHHSLCKGCSDKLQICPECRQPIQMRLKTYGP